MDLQAYGKFAFLAATEGNDSIVFVVMTVSNYRLHFSEAFAGLTSPIVASSEAQEHGHSVHRWAPGEMGHKNAGRFCTSNPII